jgi:cellulose synthase/poly-beta-1,6-N-acetylglucosamine synthase-like glycosyltransferase
VKPEPLGVTLVIPGRNAERTIASCLDAAVPLLGHDGLQEIIFVDDGSTDRTPEVVGAYPVTCLKLDGRGPGAARNLGWRAATTPLIWFLDADCVAEPDTLQLLLLHLDDPDVAGVGGSYGNMHPDSLLACLIHEEIRERHLSMDADVNYLGSFNVLYRREVLESVGGFDETFITAEDADLSYRITARGHHLRVEPSALAGHHHPTRLRPYLRTQRLHGYWASRLYARHRGNAFGNSYASFLDHIQPVVAIAALMGVPGLALSRFRFLSLALLLALFLLHLPMTGRLLRRTGSWRMALFAPLGMLRAVARGLGMCRGLVGAITYKLNPRRDTFALLV